MSRSAAKSRTDKRGASSASSPQQTVQPVETVDIVPGHLTESSWINMLKREECEEVVAELVEEILEGVMNRCYQVYLQKQLVPFAVCWARSVLVQTVEWQFLVRDEGESPDSICLWLEDLEPSPSVSDAWAEGCVPVVYTKAKPHTPLLQKLLDLHAAECDGQLVTNTHDKTQTQCRKTIHQIDPQRSRVAAKPNLLVSAAKPKENLPPLRTSQALSKSKTSQKIWQAQSLPVQGAPQHYKIPKPMQISKGFHLCATKKEQDEQVSQETNFSRAPRSKPLGQQSDSVHMVRKLDPLRLSHNQIQTGPGKSGDVISKAIN